MIRMKRLFATLCFAWLLVASLAAQKTLPLFGEDSHSFIIANDLGRNGYYEQKPIAERMGMVAEQNDIEFVAAVGDVHHFEGVASTSDPLWMTNYELIYAHPELMIDWYAVCGNHEYRGNTQAVLDYSQVSRRWNAPAKYYKVSMEAGDNETVDLFFIDTTPLIDKYREDTEKYPDAGKQSVEEQLAWLEDALRNSTAKWKIVLGHHPVYAQTYKTNSERDDMQRRVQPLLEKYGVDLYVCGHIHNFQHIKQDNEKVNYLVNSSGSLARDVQPVTGTRFCSSEAGFTVVNASDKALSFYLLDADGNVLYDYVIEKK